MALSGSFYTNVASRWRLQLEWSASQSISGNYSDVTARLYWIALDSYGAVYSSATKTCSITIDGSSSSKSESGMAKLSGNQKKQIHSYTKRINHNSDGTKSFSLSAWFDAQVTLDETYYNRISLSSRSFTLNTIPRASSITSSADWTAGNSRSVTISRASSSFTHTVRWQVKNSSGSWITIKTATGVGTSHGGEFSVAENTEIFKALAQRGSTDSRIELVTYSGGTQIGSTVYKTGKVTAPTPSTLTYASNFNIGQTAGFSIWRANNSFKHTLTVKFGNFSKTIASNFDTSASWNTSSDANNLYAQIPNSNYGTGTYELTTYYNGVKVQFTRSYTFTLNVVNSNPNFTSNFKYADINSTTKNITGNDQYIIQNNSNVRVTIPVANRATAKNHATMVRYEATLNGITKTANWSDKSDVIIDFGTVNANNNVTLTVKAIDSRGNSTSVSKTVTIVPYSMPTANFTAERVNNFENQTVLKLSGRISPLTINSSNKNSIVTARYRYKKSKNNTYGSWQNFSVSGVPNYTASNINLNLDNLESWDIQVEVTDKLGTVIVTRNVPVGRPIFFIDSDRMSIGVNKLPDKDESFETPYAEIDFLSSGKIDVTEIDADILTIKGKNVEDIANPAGVIQMFAGSTAPSGWLICDGREVSRTTYSRLFSVIGTTYGAGNGSTTFNLPDLRGRVPVGLNPNDSSFNALNKKGGAKTHKLTQDEMPKHQHNVGNSNAGGTELSYTPYLPTHSSNKGFPTNIRTDYRGDDQPHNNLQPYITLNFIIKT